MKSCKETLTEVMQSLWAIAVSSRAAAEKLAIMLDTMENTPKAVPGMTEIEEAELRGWCRQQTEETISAALDSVSIGLKTGFYKDEEVPRMLDRQVILGDELDRFYADKDRAVDELLAGEPEELGTE